ncbi:type VI secretion system baseplate subunit TssK [Phytobacter diazotrophicus]|uniref:Type VI secretion system-associated protein n=1 Tax=Phytobacter diazotrophicus TaxID=395631 RepID=A0ABM7W086_9ENTR|nr:type VI secretion system baseplate subunit TssK [Phytobacter diazotrophicus]MDU4151490.1 type VI secretion system baseplate subunit TssK [Enterobacteriaceae bacterium]PXW55970.1 type VI secretion system protein ImpJ [Grimontella sp. AG753]BDD52904.1 type VI secretion system-associated protein [Phytobacter diazotrophicus]BEG83832.1 type VI secretion system baseplate subunit TssK [Phytobacter diazotrophicus]BEG89730.1 type VI secretion system baseplate subunit TssK [Phytobacter diazotrophicus
MKIYRPLWAEGTFLSSQQFQQQARWETFSNYSIAHIGARHPWGVACVEFDESALALGKLKAQSLRVRFPDGVLVDTAVSDVLPPACDLTNVAGINALTVLLALPLEHSNGGNLGQDALTDRPLRYRQEWQTVQDIYGSDSEDIAVERYALSLRFAHDNNADYVTCPLARLIRDSQGNWALDDSYVPPLLAFNAHQAGMQCLEMLQLQLQAKSRRLMAMRRESNQRMADFAVADVSLFWLLNALNSVEPILADFLRYPAVHPELVWRELARLAGSLLTFSLDHSVSAIPAYIHDSPSQTFPPLFTLLNTLLEASLPSRVIALELDALPGNRWKADLHDPRLREEADFYLSVRSSLAAHLVINQLPRVCKIGAPDDVTHLINVALNGIPIVPLTQVPAALPLRLENHYFALDMHCAPAKAMLESGCCMIYVPGTMGDLKPELFAVLRA